MFRTVPSRRLLAVTVALAVAGLAAAVPPAQAATAGSAGTATLPALAKDVTISGTKTGYVRVRLPQRAVLGTQVGDRSPDAIRVTGGGQVAGFALVRETGSPAIVGGHTASTRDLAQRDGEFVTAPLRAEPDPATGGYVLPAGIYRLYLVTDGKPTTARLRLSGLRGAASFTPKVASPYVRQGGQPKVSTSQSGGVLYSAGYDTVLRGRSLNWQLGVTRHQAHLATSAWICAFAHKPAGPNPYLPGCASTAGPSTADHILVSGESVGTNASLVYGGLVTRGGGPHAAGIALLSAAAVNSADYQHFWLGL